MAKEQRASKRVPIKFKVDWKSEGTFLFENATNISEHGIFIQTKKTLSPGTILTLHFNLPDTNEKIAVEGEVAWVNEASKEDEQVQGMGVRFTRLSDVDRDTILALIKRIAVLESAS